MQHAIGVVGHRPTTDGDPQACEPLDAVAVDLEAAFRESHNAVEELRREQDWRRCAVVAELHQGVGLEVLALLLAA